jgi:hypothetical protein
VAVDERALLGIGEKRDGSRHVVRGGEAAHWDAALDVLIGVAASGLVFYIHIGLDPAGADGVHPHVASAPLRREGARQPNKPVLARVVRRPVRNAEEPSHRTYVHDAPRAQAEHLPAKLPAREERAGEIYLEHAPPVG